MDKKKIIAKVMMKLSLVTVDQLIDILKDPRRTNPISLPRITYSWSQQMNNTMDENKKLLDRLIEEKIHEISPKHKQAIEYLAKKLFKISDFKIR